jgi:hypothetical protein
MLQICADENSHIVEEAKSKFYQSLVLNLVERTTVRSSATAIGGDWNHLMPKLISEPD